MNNKLIVSGCSYSAHAGQKPYPDILKKHGYGVYNMAWCGASNESIIKKIYDCIEKNDVKESLILCQLTYTHRIGWYHNFVKRWIDYQPKRLQTIPKYDVQSDTINFEITTEETYMEGGSFHLSEDVNKDDYKILTNMYKTWLEYVYDEDEMFNYLLYKIDTLTSYVESKNNKIKFIYWPEIKNKKYLEQIEKREFFNVDGEYSMLKWSTKNDIIDSASHLTKDGHNILSSKIDTFISDNNLLNKITNIL
jgi:hypothetical protein